MAVSFKFKEWGLLPMKRLIAVDPGTHSIKLALVESFLGRVRVVREEAFTLKEEGLVSPEEVQDHLRSILKEMGPHPVALALPQTAALCRVIDLPPVSRQEVGGLIEEEAVKLSGLSESAIIYDYDPLRPFGQNRNPYWVTLCQESEVAHQIARSGLVRENICQVTSSANAAAAAFLWEHPGADRVLLLDIGAASTSVTLLEEGQCVYGASFPIGGDAFTEALALQNGWPLEEAEENKRVQDFFPQGQASPEFRPVIRSWWDEIERAVAECAELTGSAQFVRSELEVVLFGGGASQPGLESYVRQRMGGRVRLWTDSSGRACAPFAIAFGAALQAFGKTAQRASLLPEDLRAIWKSQQALQTLQCANALLLLLAALILAGGTFYKVLQLQRRNELLAQARSVLSKVESTQELADDLALGYDGIRPILLQQKKTFDSLRTLQLLQQARSTQNVWFVFLADPQSYWNADPFPVPAPTNPPPAAAPAPASTNQPPPAVAVAPPAAPAPAPQPTNPPAVFIERDGFVAELTTPLQGDALREALSAVVAQLKKDPLFANVDLLPANQRRFLVDPKVVLPESHFALFLQLAKNEYARVFPKTAPPASTSPKKPVRSGTTFKDRSNPAPGNAAQRK